MNEAPDNEKTIPVPGYTLTKRLGTGGYGEVWLAHAPGGLAKATLQSGRSASSCPPVGDGPQV